ncbi:hypothetical protein HDU98_007713, partial [Podochytrium sp. JEL0797]
MPPSNPLAWQAQMLAQMQQIQSQMAPQGHVTAFPASAHVETTNALPPQPTSQRPQRHAAQHQAAPSAVPAVAAQQTTRTSARFTTEQTDELEIMFQRNQNPDREAQEFLAAQIGLSYDQVRKWMGRRRQRTSAPTPYASTSTAATTTATSTPASTTTRQTRQRRQSQPAATTAIQLDPSDSTMMDFQRESSIQSDESFLDNDAASSIAPEDDSSSLPTTTAAVPHQPIFITVPVLAPSPPLQNSPVATPPPTTTAEAAPAVVTMEEMDFSGTSAGVTKYLKWLSASEGCEQRRERVRLEEVEVSEEFYEGLAQSKSYKGLILLRQWTQEAVTLAAAGDVGQAGLLKELLKLLLKLPIGLEGLKVSKLGRVVQGVEKSDGVDEEAKKLAARLTSAWKALVSQKAG